MYCLVQRLELLTESFLAKEAQMGTNVHIGISTELPCDCSQVRTIPNDRSETTATPEVRRKVRDEGIVGRFAVQQDKRGFKGLKYFAKDMHCFVRFGESLPFVLVFRWVR